MHFSVDLTPLAQGGLREWALWAHNDEAFFDRIGCSPTEWAWVCFQLRVAEDRPSWFPHGKLETLQFIERHLADEARVVRDAAKQREVATHAPCD